MKHAIDLNTIAIISLLPKFTLKWTCGSCGGGNDMSMAYCQWCS